MQIYETKKIGDIVSRDGDKFSVFLGLDKDLIKQLKNYSLDESDIDLQKNTGDRARFGIGSYEDWYKKGRTPFALVHDNTHTLSAFVWLGPKSFGKKSIKFGKEAEEKEDIKDSWHTLAVRSYAPFRGKGITKVFCNFVLDFYKREFGSVSVWAGMDDRNESVLRLSEALGFTKREDLSDLNSHWLIMIKEL
jgi:GNAT superfamily N-acetyltransferase